MNNKYVCCSELKRSRFFWRLCMNALSTRLCGGRITPPRAAEDNGGAGLCVDFTYPTPPPMNPHTLLKQTQSTDGNVAEATENISILDVTQRRRRHYPCFSDSP